MVLVAALLFPQLSIYLIHFQIVFELCFELASSFILHPDSFTKAYTYKWFQASIRSWVSAFLCYLFVRDSILYLPSTAVFLNFQFLLQMWRCKHGHVRLTLTCLQTVAVVECIPTLAIGACYLLYFSFLLQLWRCKHGPVRLYMNMPVVEVYLHWPLGRVTCF